MREEERKLSGVTRKSYVWTNEKTEWCKEWSNDKLIGEAKQRENRDKYFVE